MTELEKLKITEELRQVILDYGHASGPFTNMDIVRAIGVNESRVQQQTLNMIKSGELIREWRNRVAYYTSVATVTESAESVRAKSRELKISGIKNTRKKNAEEYKPLKTEPWRFVNNNPDRLSISCPDAMGSRGMAWGIQSSMA